MERFDPVPVSVVVAPSAALEAIRSSGLAASTAVASNDELAIVRAVARCLGVTAQLRLRAVNGFPGRLPLEHAGQDPAYPILGEDVRMIGTDPSIIRIHPMGFPTVLNLSQAAPTWLEEAGDITASPLAAALRTAAEEMLVVVAAGRARNGVGNLSSVASLPWTIAVGAAEPDGSTLSASSPRGTPEIAGPYVCASKLSEHETPRAGTSFAAPRVARELLVLAGFFRTLAHTMHDNNIDGISLGVLAIVDEGRPHPERLARLPIASFPLRAGVDADAAFALAGMVGSAVEGLGDRRLWARALGRSARPMPNHQSHEVGHGFVSADTTLAYLRALTPREVLHLADITVLDGNDALDALLANADLERAAEVWARGSIVAYADYASDDSEVF